LQLYVYLDSLLLVERPFYLESMRRKPRHSIADTREALLESALLCFARYGYDATSVRLVGTVARKNASLIFYHFGSKEGLYREVIRHLFSRYLASPFLDPAGPGEEAGQDRLRRLIERVLAQVCAHGGTDKAAADASTRLFLSELGAPKSETRDLLRDRLLPLVQEIRACIREIRPELRDPEIDLWGTVIQGSCFGHALMDQADRLVWSHLDGWADPAGMSERLSSFVFSGLKNLSPTC